MSKQRQRPTTGGRFTRKADGQLERAPERRKAAKQTAPAEQAQAPASDKADDKEAAAGTFAGESQPPTSGGKAKG